MNEQTHSQKKPLLLAGFILATLVTLSFISMLIFSRSEESDQADPSRLSVSAPVETEPKIEVDPSAPALQSPECDSYAQSILDAERIDIELYRCEIETFMADNGNVVHQVRAVAGEVEEQWEHECGAFILCATPTGWVDNEGQLLDFLAPPRSLASDPAAEESGCGFSDVRFGSDIDVEPELVYVDGQYRWRVEYDGRYTTDYDGEQLSCLLKGVSLIGPDDTVAELVAVYAFDLNDCKDLERTNRDYCSTAWSTVSQNKYACQHDFMLITDIETELGVGCEVNYTAWPDEDADCGPDSFLDGDLTCSKVGVVVMPILEEYKDKARELDTGPRDQI